MTGSAVRANAAPVFAGGTVVSVQEGGTAVTRVTATDSDSEDVLGYSITGGAARDAFTIDKATGALAFKTAPSYDAQGSNDYVVEVTATSGAAACARSASRTITVTVTPLPRPSAPTVLTASAAGTTAIGLSWTAPAAAPSRAAVTGYSVEVSPTGTDSWTALATVAGAAVTSYRHTGLSPATTRHYRVKASSASGDSPWSNVASATTERRPPLPPADLRAAAQGRSAIGLSWTAPAPAPTDAPVTGYRIEVSPTGTDSWTALATADAAVTSYRHEGLLPRRHPALPGEGVQRLRRQSLVERRFRDHRETAAAAGRSARGRSGPVDDRPLLDGARAGADGRAGDRLPDRGVAHRDRLVDRARHRRCGRDELPA